MAHRHFFFWSSHHTVACFSDSLLTSPSSSSLLLSSHLSLALITAGYPGSGASVSSSSVVLFVIHTCHRWKCCDSCSSPWGQKVVSVVFFKWRLFFSLSFLRSCRSSTVSIEASKRRKTLKIQASRLNCIVIAHVTSAQSNWLRRNQTWCCSRSSSWSWRLFVLVCGCKVVPLVWPKKISIFEDTAKTFCEFTADLHWPSERFWCCVTIYLS